ncbi:hypothetical protein VPHD81_0037 [Vibrio phage D81]
MSVRVLHVTDTQQKIIKLHIDGNTNEQIMDKLAVEECDVYLALLIVQRYLPKVWHRSVDECWRLLKEWNIASTLVLVLCLAPMIEVNNHNTDRVRTTRTTRTTKTRSSRKNDLDLFDLFEIC